MFQFDYSFLVPANSSLRQFADVDRAGIRISVVRNHASTMALTRMVKHAELVGFDLPDDTFDALRGGNAEAFAAPRQILDRICRAAAGRARARLKVTASIASAWRWRSIVPGLLSYLAEFVEEAKASGLIVRFIAQAGLRGFQVTP